MWIALALLAATVLGVIGVQRKGIFLAQYLFFLRYPILFGLLLFVGPWLSISLGRDLVGNLFALGFSGIATVSALGWFVASTVVYTFNLIFSLTCVRTGLPLFKPKDPDARPAAIKRQEALARRLADLHDLLSWVLLLPLAAVLLIRAPGSKLQAVGGLLLGAGLAATVAWSWPRQIQGYLRAIIARTQKLVGPSLTKRRSPPFIQWLASTFADGYTTSGNNEARWHGRALLFLGVSLLIYFGGFFIMRASFVSTSRALADTIPVLAYILLLMMVFTWVFTGLSFYLDKFRVPPGLAILGCWMVWHVFGAEDNYFGLSRAAHASQAAATQPGLTCGLLPTAAAEAWAGRHHSADGHKPTIVVVAASGGGITASLWTARVLTALASPDEGIGPDFANAITLISSASGGGLGAAYFVDAYDGRGGVEFDKETVRRVVRAAGASSLQDTAFALAYAGDRGLALENSWSRWLSKPDVKLSGWREGVQSGWRPAQIFNVTIAETGERLLLGPIDCPTQTCVKSGVFWRGQSLPDLYGPGCDLPVVTAARLSATFPWVTPLSRAPPGDKEYHLGDGGYYDNFGIVTAIEWLSSIHAGKKGLAEIAEKILVVQIRASEDARESPANGRGWYYSTLGPLVTLLNVRTTSQRNHNDAQLLGLKALLAGQDIALETVEFELAIKSPLSWHLTEDEKKEITSQWTRNQVIAEKREKLRCLWSKSPEHWPEACHTEPPIDLQSRQGPAELFKQVQETAARAVAEPAPGAASAE